MKRALVVILAALVACGCSASVTTRTAVAPKPDTSRFLIGAATQSGSQFKQATGVAPYRWLTKQRVERAKELLQDPGRELADIAQRCGFVDQSHFTRVFSRSEGYSPGRWRRLHRC